MKYVLATAAAAMLLGATAASAAAPSRAIAASGGQGPYLDYSQTWSGPNADACRARLDHGTGYYGCGTATGGPVGGLPDRN